MVDDVVTLEVLVELFDCDIEAWFAISDLTYDGICRFIDREGVRQRTVWRNRVLEVVS